MKWTIPDPDAMRAWGHALGRGIKGGGLVFLSGDLGAGKTTLSHGILAGMGYGGRVKSPTYTLVEVYDTPRGMVYHFDLYRLCDPDELDMIGFRDYLNEHALSLVEWPEKGEGVLPGPDLHFMLDVRDQTHTITLISATGQGRRWLQNNCNNASTGEMG